MTPAELVEHCRELLARADPKTAGLWPRCVAFLLRQALEARLATVLDRLAPGVRAASYRSQIIALTVLSPQPELARRVAFTWSALSAATHYHGYELPPAAADLHGWLRTVESFVAVGLPPGRK